MLAKVAYVSSDAMWRWLDGKGVHREVDSIMLHEALRSGRLDQTVPVWREGMDSFEPANQVPELLIWCRSAPEQPPINRGPVGTVVPATGAARDAMMRMARQGKADSNIARSSATAEDKDRSSSALSRSSSDSNKLAVDRTSAPSASSSKSRGSKSDSIGQRRDKPTQKKRQATLIGQPVRLVSPPGGTGSETSLKADAKESKSRVSVPPPVPSAATVTKVLGSRIPSVVTSSRDSDKDASKSEKEEASSHDLEVIEELDINELEDASVSGVEEVLLDEEISQDDVSSAAPSSPPQSGAYGPVSASSPPPPRLGRATKSRSKPPTPLGAMVMSVFDVGTVDDTVDGKDKAGEVGESDKADKVAKEHKTVLDGSGDKLTVALTDDEQTSDSEGAPSQFSGEVASHSDLDGLLGIGGQPLVDSAADAGDEGGGAGDAADLGVQYETDEFEEWDGGDEREGDGGALPAVVRGLRAKKGPNRRLMMVVGGVVGVAVLVLVVAGMSRLWSKKKESTIDPAGDKAIVVKDETARPAASSVASAAVGSAQVAQPTGASGAAVGQPGADGIVQPEKEPVGALVKGGQGQACKPTDVRKRLVVGASKDVPLETWSNEEALQFAIGFAGLNNTGIGFVLDPMTLDTKRSFTKRAPEPIIRVVPVKVGDVVDFELDTSGPSSPVGQRLTVANNKQLLRLGTFKNSLTISTDKDALPSVLWRLPGNKELEVMRAIPVGERGLALVFRSDAALWMGWVDGDNKPVGQLEKVAGTGVRVGTPFLAYNGSKVLLTFADQAVKSGAWGIRTVMVGYGEALPSSQAWQVPSGGPEGDVISPTSLGLRDGRWVMVWTQGNAGSRVVRVQTLSGDLAPIGEAFVVSRQGSNAGQGLATLSSKGGAVVYLSLNGTTYEVWGAGMRCGSSAEP